MPPNTQKNKERDGVSSSSKRHTQSMSLEKVKGCCFTSPFRSFNQSMLQTYHEDPKESKLNGHPMTPLRPIHTAWTNANKQVGHWI